MISAIIPVLNESTDLLTRVVTNLTDGISPDDLEVIVVNDGSKNPDGSFKPLVKELSFLRDTTNIKFLDRKEQYGVGHSFDRGSEVAQGTILVLMGSDVFPEKGWFNSVLHACTTDMLGSCCSVGLSGGNFDINKEGCVSRYGAKILYTMTNDDLPKSSPMKNIPNYKDILEAKWIAKQSDDPYEIPCPYGAYYFVKKEFYNRFHGWDTVAGKHFSGHMRWGCLEPMLALKVKVYGGKVIMFPDIRVGHYFGRITQDNVDSHRSVRDDLKWWNKLWCLYTMFEEDFRDELLAFPNHSLNFSQAKAYIRQNWDIVQEARERNKREATLIGKMTV